MGEPRAMRRAARLLIGMFAALLAAFAGFNSLVDPYDVVGWARFEGFNARKTRAHEDGRRVTVSHRLLTETVGTFLLGSSRVVDGFPDDHPGWPGGLMNAGMRGSNAFELARAAVVAGRNPHLRCLVIGLDLDELGSHEKAKATYWISALPDGSRALGLIRAALSPQTFARALQTVSDNVAGGSDSHPWKERYEPGWQRARFEDSLASALSRYRIYEPDPERLAFLGRAIDGLVARGVQVALFIHPVHAFREEAIWQAGAGAEQVALRAGLAALAARHADAEPAASCMPGPALQVWDFAGFQDIAVTPPPGREQAETDPYWHEPPHYRPPVGAAMLDRMLGTPTGGLFAPERFGRRVESAALPALAAEEAERRRRWGEGTPEGRAVRARLLALADKPVARSQMRAYLTKDDHRALARDVRRLQAQGARAEIARARSSE